MPGDFKVARIKQVFRFNSVHINKIPLYTACCCIIIIMNSISTQPYYTLLRTYVYYHGPRIVSGEGMAGKWASRLGE